MKSSHLRNHLFKLLALLAVANMALIACLAGGRVKAWSEIAWMDVAGEGGLALFILSWLLMLFSARPRGRVTAYLGWGLALLFFSAWMDWLDEFIQMPATVAWDGWLESGPLPVGLICLTLGLYHWHREQVAINTQMEKSEHFYRDHRQYDSLTPLGRADYLRGQLSLALAHARAERGPLSLVGVDVENFSAINHRFGVEEGDAVLLALSQLLLLNLRRQDLLCRLAGDRFVVLLPNTGEAQAWRIAGELRESTRHLAYRTRDQGERLHLRVAVAAVMAVREDADELLERLNGAFLPGSAALPVA